MLNGHIFKVRGENHDFFGRIFGLVAVWRFFGLFLIYHCKINFRELKNAIRKNIVPSFRSLGVVLRIKSKRNPLGEY